MPTVSAHVAVRSPPTSTTSSASSASPMRTSSTLWRARPTPARPRAARGRRRRRGRRLPPGLRPARRGDDDLRRRLHQYPHGAAEAVQAHVPLVLVVGDEPTLGPRPGRRPDRDGLGGRRPHVHRGRADAAATTVIAVEHALTFRVPTVLAIPYDVATPNLPGPRDPVPAGAPAPHGPRGVRRRRGPRDCDCPARARRPLLLAGRGAWTRARARRSAPSPTPRCADDDDGAWAGCSPGRSSTSASPAGSGPERRWSSSARPTRGGRRRLARPVHDALRGVFAPGCRVFQVDVAPAASHPHVGGYVRGDAAVVAEAILEQLGESVPSGGGRPSTSRRSGGRTPGWGPRTTVASTRGRQRPGSPSCSRRTASSSRTAGTSSAGRTCTGRWPRRTGWRWSARRPGDRPRLPQRGGRGARPSRRHGGLTRRRRRPDGPVRPRVCGAGRGPPRDRRGVERRGYSAEMHLYGRRGLAREPMLIPDVDFAGSPPPSARRECRAIGGGPGGPDGIERPAGD